MVATAEDDRQRCVLARVRTARRQRDARAEAVAQGRDSPTCDPREILFKLLGKQLRLKKGPPSRAWFIQWLAQQAVPRLLGGPGPALLLLQVTSRVNGKTGYAWIASRTLTALIGCDPETVKRYRRSLTAPWQIAGEWFPPLFRLRLVGQGQRGLRRRVHWIPIEAGWAAFLELVDEASRAVTDEAWERKPGREDGV